MSDPDREMALNELARLTAEVWLHENNMTPCAFDGSKTCDCNHHFLCPNRPPQVADPVVERVVDDLRRRSAVGLKKYGVALDRTDLTQEQWIEHAYSEALDLSNYLCALLMRVRGELP